MQLNEVLDHLQSIANAENVAGMVRFGINSRWLALPQYFVITNLACLIALFKLVRGERYIKWEPVRERAASV